MKVITTYVAYDDTYFYTREECEEYESKAVYYINQFNHCCALFDANKNLIYLPVVMNVEEAIDWLNRMIEECEYIEINKFLPTEVFDFLKKNIDYCLPENKIGLYKYNYNEGEWVSAD